MLKEIAVTLAVIAFYLAPTITAFIRGHASKWAILMLNIFTGWTIVGWFWSAIWSLANKGASTNVVVTNINSANQQ